jgi:hypothetical protein
MNKSFVPVFLVLGCIALGLRAEAPNPPLPTQSQIDELVAAGNFPQALQAIARVLPTLNSLPAPSAKRYALYMAQGEALLQTRHAREAEDAFIKARDQASRPEDAALPASTALLVHRASVGLTYTPRATPDKLPPLPAAAVPAATGTRPATQPASLPPPPPAGEPLSIVPPAQRKAALLGLFYDELMADATKIKAAQSGTALAPITDVAPHLGDLRLLELAATGADVYSLPMEKELTIHAQQLMQQALTAMSKQVDEATRAANEVIATTTPASVTGTGANQRVIPAQTTYHKHGLTATDANNLQSIIATCGKFGPAVKALTAALHVDAQRFDSLATQADAVRQKATTTLNADYTQTYLNPPR